MNFVTQGSVLGPEEFFEGLGIGLRSFFAAGVIGKLYKSGSWMLI